MKFSTVLVARGQERPSDLEVSLRQYAQKLRVCRRLNGAHFVFPDIPGLALCCYYPNQMDANNNNNRHEKQDEALNELSDFCRHFQHSLVIFVDHDDSFLNDPHSFLNRAMDLVYKDPPEDTDPPRMIVVANTAQVCKLLRKQTQKIDVDNTTHTLFLFLLPHAHTVDALATFAESVTPQRKQLRDAFNQKVLEDNMLVENVPNETYHVAVVSALRDMCDDMGCPLGEADLLIKSFGTLRNIAKATESTLSNVPIETSTKHALLGLFAGKEAPPDDTLPPPTTMVSPPPASLHMEPTEYYYNAGDSILDATMYDEGAHSFVPRGSDFHDQQSVQPSRYQGRPRQYYYESQPYDSMDGGFVDQQQPATNPRRISTTPGAPPIPSRDRRYPSSVSGVEFGLGRFK